MGECKASVSLCARRATSCANFSLSRLQSRLLCDNRQLSLNQSLQLKPRERGQTPDWVLFCFFCCHETAEGQYEI